MQTKRLFLKTFILTLATILLATSAQSKNCLWKVESKTGSLYVLGSVHLLKGNDYPLAPAIEEAYGKSESLVFEADMAAMMSPETQQLIMSKAMLSGTQTLKDSLDPDVYSQLAERFKATGLPIEGFQKFKPWFASLTLVMMKMQSMGFNPMHGIDQHFHAKAVADKKPVLGFETAEFQINLFDSLAEGNQNAYMKRALKDLELVETMLEDIMAAWRTGNIEKLGQLMQESFEEYPELKTRFLLERNKQWAEKLETMLNEKKTYMVVVGAAHLPGKDGLLELLKKQGCKLEQL